MRIVTLNVNGIRAAARRGFFAWLIQQDFDVICLQEIKALPEQLTDPIFYPLGYQSYFFPAEKKGYSGVALYTRYTPTNVIKGLGWDLADKEGRYIEAEFGDLSVVSLYLPSGTSSVERQACKYQFMDFFNEHLQRIIKSKRHYVLCGDWNIAHTKNDLKNCE